MARPAQAGLSRAPGRPFARWSGSIIVAALLLAGGGCGEDTVVTTTPQQCTQATCPNGWCDVNVSFDTTCAGKLAFAEVLLDGALEPNVANYGGTFTSTGHVRAGEDGLFFVRGEDWQWRISFTCNNPATDGEYRLACTNDDDGVTAIGADVTDDTSTDGEDAAP